MIKRVLSKLRKVTMSLFAVLCAGAVWAEEGDVTYVTTPMDDPSAGYIRTGLGKKGNEVAVVFTNHTKTATWTVPANLRNVEFLVVGGGGGGGADCWDGVAQGGAGGGGGGVIVGLVNFTNGTIVSVNVGKGGTGGSIETKPGSSTYNYWGAAKNDATASDFSVAGVNYVTANAGGRDQGSSSISKGMSGGQVGGAGGSSAGSRPGVSGKGAANPGEVNPAVIISCTKMAHQGGAGNTGADFWGFYSAAGGGGGATENGGTPSDYTTGGKGGEGFASDITGTLLVYGSGGGGGTISRSFGGKGGTGAGDGNVDFYTATSALPNQGGGGGGGGRGDILAQSMGVKTSGDGGSGIVVFRYSVYEAEVVTAEGSTPYATFAEAFDAAQAGETVKLLNDVTLAEKLTIKKAVTLDLNGCTLSETVTDNYGALYVGTAGNLTITDSAEGGKIATDGGVVVGNYGTVTVNGGTIEAGENPEVDVSVYNFYYNGSTYGKLTVTGGKVGRIWNCGNANITAGEVVDIDNSGAMTIAETATVSGTVIIKNGSDAAEVPGAGTLTAPESLTVQVGNEGAEAFYVDGKWLVQVVVATIGEAKFATLDAAIAAAGADDEVVVVADIATDAAFVVTKKVAVNLNGKTIATTQADTEGNGVFWVKTGGELTLNGEGTVNGVGGNAYNIAIWADGGKVIINGGTYTNVGAQDSGPDGAHFDLIYAKNGGSVEINGGTFKCETPNWTLNSHDTAKGTIVVKGGTFYQFNPANCTTEGANTNFCADGLCGYVVETVDGVDVYGVAAVVATIGEAKFASLDAAIAAAGADDEVLVVADIATDAAFEITKKVAVNLNGKTIATTQADTEGNGVFWVKAGGELTLYGEGTVNGVGGNAYNIAIWADGGKVIINGGTYTNEGAQDDGPDGAHFDLIYVKNGGAVEINGGTFKCQTPEWTLNSHDTAKGTIVVNGGLFYQFNPSDCATEGAGTNWCAEGLKGAESVENAGYYEIVDAWTAPLPEKDGEAPITEEYTSEVLSALEAKLATSVNVKVNGVELKGDEAIKALNTAVASFDDALTFDGTAAILDIEIKVTEVNTEDPAASTVVVKRGTEELTVKVTPTVKYFYPETKTWGSDKPESGAVLFKLVF